MNLPSDPNEGRDLAPNEIHGEVADLLGDEGGAVLVGGRRVRLVHLAGEVVLAQRALVVFPVGRHVHARTHIVVAVHDNVHARRVIVMARHRHIHARNVIVVAPDHAVRPRDD